MLIHCVNDRLDTRRLVRQLFFSSRQSKDLNNHRPLLSKRPSRPSSAPDPRLQLSHWLHQVTKEIRPVWDTEHMCLCLTVPSICCSADICK